MAADLAYYGHYSIDDLVDGAEQAVIAACAAFYRCDSDGMREAIESHSRFAMAHAVACERAAQKYLQ